MPLDPITGPFSREKFAELVAAPFGGAAKEIRKVDPLWGRTTGEKIKWRVRFSREVTEIAEEIVEAATEKEAADLANKITSGELDWEADDWETPSIDSIDPET